MAADACFLTDIGQSEVTAELAREDLRQVARIEGTDDERNSEDMR